MEPLEMSRDEFEGLVAEALDTIPAELARLMSNVVVVVEDHAPAEDPGLLGLYSGIPLTERDGSYAGFLPDQVTIFMGPIVGMCETRDDVVEEVRITVVHEIAHHFGIDDARLEELGYE
jgi:predicted Zn-dependent protease with MMP-like domain